MQARANELIPYSKSTKNIEEFKSGTEGYKNCYKRAILFHTIHRGAISGEV